MTLSPSTQGLTLQYYNYNNTPADSATVKVLITRTLAVTVGSSAIEPREPSTLDPRHCVKEQNNLLGYVSLP